MTKSSYFGEWMIYIGTHEMSKVENLYFLILLNCEDRFTRHSALNDITAKALRSINTPAKLELMPTGLYLDDGKLPDGMTLIAWKIVQPLVWDATCADTDTFASSYIKQTSVKDGSAVTRKHNLYKGIKSQNYKFVALAVETMGSWSIEAMEFFSELGKKLEDISGDPHCRQFLYQKISLAI